MRKKEKEESQPQEKYSYGLEAGAAEKNEGFD
jgi:hypothetical protein